MDDDVSGTDDGEAAKVRIDQSSEVGTGDIDCAKDSVGGELVESL